MADRMTFTGRPEKYSLVAVALVGLELVVRAAVGRPYVGATPLLLVALGVSWIPLLPAELRRPSLEFAIAPALAIGSFAILLTTVSISGVGLTETSVRVSVILLVVGLAVVASALSPDPALGSRSWSPWREAVVLASVGLLLAFSFASAWDLATPFQPAGSDVGHYLLYADEVAEQRALLIEDPFADDGSLFADPPAIGAVYGSFLILDGVSSWTLARGLPAVSAISVLSVFVAAGALWGAAAGIAAGSAYAVAPVRLDTMYWHGLGTSLALVFVPLVVLALGLLFRERRDWRIVAFLALALVSIAASHSTSAIVVAVTVCLAPAVDVALRAVSHRSGLRAALRSSWSQGVLGGVTRAIALACLLGVGVIAHLRSQLADLGPPVDYRFLGPDWLDRAAIAGYYSWSFLALAALAVLLVTASRPLRGDCALLAVVTLALACVVVSQSWRIHVPFEYRRVVYYLGIALVLVVGVAFVRLRRRLIWVAVFVFALGFIARGSVGLRLPERVLSGSGPEAAATVGLREFRQSLDAGKLADSNLLVADSCLGFSVPYFVRRPTIAAFGERQVGFVNRVPLARKASRVLEGGHRGRELARRMGIGYAVVDPRCVPSDLALRLGGRVVLENKELVVVQLQ